MIPWRIVVALLMIAASFGTIIRASDASLLGRVGGVFAAAAMLGVGIAVVRRQQWAFGVAFLLGLCWFWAVLALRIQGVLPPAEVAMWLAWSVIVIVGTIRGRET
jgi:hypothetical protein